MLGLKERRLGSMVPPECRGLGLAVNKLGGVSAELVPAEVWRREMAVFNFFVPGEVSL